MKKILLALTVVMSVISFTGCAELAQAQKQKQQQQQRQKTGQKPGQKPGQKAPMKPGQTTQGTKVVRVNANGVRYRDNIFPNYSKKMEVFAQGVPKYGGGAQQLKMKIYEPNGDNQNGRAAVIFCFGGGFATRVNTGMEDFMANFASKGYVAVDIDYRLGFNDAGQLFFCTGNPYNMPEAAYRAAQDVRAAVKYLRANASRLGIDPDKIFLGGISAGGIASILAVHTEDNEVSPTLNKEWGGVDAVGIAKNETFKIAGLYAFSPGLFDLNILDKAGPPTFIIQGTNDNIVPINEGIVFNCKANKNFPRMFGGEKIYERLKSFGGCTHFTVVCGGQHDLGIPVPEHVDRAAAFIYSVLNGKCDPGKDFMKSSKYSGGGNYPGCN